MCDYGDGSILPLVVTPVVSVATAVLPAGTLLTKDSTPVQPDSTVRTSLKMDGSHSDFVTAG